MSAKLEQDIKSILPSARDFLHELASSSFTIDTGDITLEALNGLAKSISADSFSMNGSIGEGSASISLTVHF